MKLHAFVFACLLFGAHAVSIDFSANKNHDSLDNVDESQQVTVDEVQHNLRTDIEIPVKIVEEQELKNSKDNVPDINESVGVKRSEIDLTNPDLSEQQANETPIPSSIKEKARMDVKEKIEETRRIFNEQLYDVATNFETLIQNDKNLPIIQQKIDNLDSSFTDQIAVLNNTLESYINSSSEILRTDLKPNAIPKTEIIQSNLRKIQKNFKHGIIILSESAELLAGTKEDEAIKGRADSESGSNSTSPSSSSTSSSTTNQNQGYFQQFMSWFYTVINRPITSIQNVTQNYNPISNINQGQQVLAPSNSQSDDASPQLPFQQFFPSGLQNLGGGSQNNQFSQFFQIPQTIAQSFPQGSSFPQISSFPQLSSFQFSNLIPTRPKTRESEEIKNDAKSDIGNNYKDQGENNEGKVENEAALVEKQQI